MIGKTILHYRDSSRIRLSPDKITEKLGEGGMGVAYKAEDTKLKRDVAIKYLPQQIAASDEERQRFKIEAPAAAALNHPNIATIYAIEEQDDETRQQPGTLFIVMEYIEGQELRKMIANLAKVQNLRKVLDIATQIVSGLQAAHKKKGSRTDIWSLSVILYEIIPGQPPFKGDYG